MISRFQSRANKRRLGRASSAKRRTSRREIRVCNVEVTREARSAANRFAENLIAAQLKARSPTLLSRFSDSLVRLTASKLKFRRDGRRTRVIQHKYGKVKVRGELARGVHLAREQ